MVGFRLSNLNPKDARKESEHRDPRKIYYIFAEGEKTELIYFKSLANHKLKKDNIEIRVMDRWNINKGHSNQYRVIKDVEMYVHKILELHKNKSIELLELGKMAVKFEQQDLTVDDFMLLSNLLHELEQEGLIHKDEEVHNQIKTVLTMSEFSEGYDQICIIIDRDLQSFKNFQYDEVVKIAKQNNYRLGISTPTFELFLLMHFEDFPNITHDEIMANEKKGKRRLLESSLISMCKEEEIKFRKYEYDATWFIDRTQTGIEKCQQFTSDLTELKGKPGTSVFDIIKEMVKIEK